METFTNSSNLIINPSSEEPVPINISASFTDSNATHLSTKHVSFENIIDDPSSSNSSYLFRSKKKLIHATLRKNSKGMQQKQHSSENIDQIISFDKTPSKSKNSQDLTDSNDTSPDLLKIMPPRDYSPGGERSLKLLNNIMERLSAKKSCKTPLRTPLSKHSIRETDSTNGTPMRTKMPRISGITSLKTAVSSPQLFPDTKRNDSFSDNRLLERSFSTPSISRSYASTTSERSELPISNELSNECLDTPKIKMINSDDDDDEDDDLLPPTQLCSQSGILNGVVAYVEVRFGADNRSWGVKGTLEDLGAAIVPRFNKNVTHVIFHEGLLSTYKKAKKRKVHIVSVLWIEECKNAKKIVSERLYPPLDIHKYENAELFKSIPRVKSIQPDFENDQPLKLTRKKLKLFNEMKEKLRKEKEEIEKVRNQIETQNKNTVSPSQRRLETFKLLLNPEDHHLLTDTKTAEFKENNSQNSDDHVTTPLAVRLWRKFNTPKENPSDIDTETQTTNKNNDIIHETDNDSSKTSGSSIIPATRFAVRSNLFPTISKQSDDCLNNKKNESSEPYLTNSDLNKVQDIDFSNQINSSNIENKTRFDDKDLSITNCSKGEITYLSDAFSSDSKSISAVKKRKLFSQPRALSFEDLGSPPSSPSSLKIPSMESLIVATQNLEIEPPSKRVCKRKTTNNKIKNKNNTNKKNTKVKASTKNDLFLGNNSTLSTNTRPSSQLFIPQIENSTPRSTRSTRSSSYLFQSDDFRNLRSTSRNSIVCTSLHRDESILVAELVNQLGGYTVDETVSSRTSHLISGRPRRTVNFLKAIARGCWVVSLDWIHACKQQNRWVEEIDYELHEFSPAVQQCRLDRLSFGPTFRLRLFEFCGRIFVSPKSDPRRQDISDLITLGSGIVTKTSRNADIIIGNYADPKTGVKIVLEKWILDSIMNNELHDINEYLI